MQSYIFKLFPNLQEFNHSKHYKELFLNQNWVLVNGIANKKAVYVFKDEKTLVIKENESVSETAWSIDSKNTFTIQNEDGNITVKAYFKDDDILVLNHHNTNNCAFFINESAYSEDLNSFEDIQNFLHDKYAKKATDLIYEHEFYFIKKAKEFGPYKVEVLAEKVKSKTISEHCFVRDVNETDYSKKLRIRDLLKAF
tara:strand:- start:479 stop:1069 length:591 start_codon:yes stop_codon:yes gene_type:complete